MSEPTQAEREAWAEKQRKAAAELEQTRELKAGNPLPEAPDYRRNKGE